MGASKLNLKNICCPMLLKVDLLVFSLLHA